MESIYRRQCHSSLALFREFAALRRVPVISELTREELTDAPDPVRDHLEQLPPNAIEAVSLDDEAQHLADAYIEHGVVGPSHIADAQHIAIATVQRVSVLASWNFKHIVNLKRICAYNGVNQRIGYGLIEIRTPREIVSEAEKDI